MELREVPSPLSEGDDQEEEWFYSPTQKTFNEQGQRICNFPNCGKKHYAKGLCSAHYNQRQRGKQLTPVQQIRKKCAVPGCNNKHAAKGYCRSHYRMQDRPLAIKDELIEGICKVLACDEESHAHGLCKKHAREQKVLEAIANLGKMRTKRWCSVEDCLEEHHAKGYCKVHYYQIAKPGAKERRDRIRYRLKKRRKREEEKEERRKEKENQKRARPSKKRKASVKMKPGPRKKKDSEYPTCYGPDCEKPGKLKGLCRAHRKQQREGKPLKRLNLPRNPKRGCCVAGCDRKHLSKGYCWYHYRHRDQPWPHRNPQPGECAIIGCQVSPDFEGLCYEHYEFLKKRKSAEEEAKKEKRCSLDNCNRKHKAKGLCRKHYEEMKRREKRE